jgi:hypothetical protein
MLLIFAQAVILGNIQDMIISIRSKNMLSIQEDASFGSITKILIDVIGYGRKEKSGRSRVCFKYRHNPEYKFWFARRNIYKVGIE